MGVVFVVLGNAATLTFLSKKQENKSRNQTESTLQTALGTDGQNCVLKKSFCNPLSIFEVSKFYQHKILIEKWSHSSSSNEFDSYNVCKKMNRTYFLSSLYSS